MSDGKSGGMIMMTKSWRHLWYGLTVTGLLAGSALLTVAADGPEPDGREKYRILEENNFFLRDRSRRDPQPAREPPRPPPQPERYIVLRGIASRNGRYIAFLEDTRTRQVMLRSAGETVADGLITAISLDHLKYEKEAETVIVELANTLQGTALTLSGTGEPAGSAVRREQDNSRHETAGPEDRRAILERLRQRRQEELN